MPIPKIIHQIWIGPISLPKYLQDFSESWKKMNPDYLYKYHNNESVALLLETYYPKYKKIFYNLKFPVQQADFIRYLIIYHYGGFYTDFDTTCVKSLNIFQSKTKDVIIGIDKKKNLEYIQWFFGSKPKNPIFLNIIRNIIKNIKTHKFSNQFKNQDDNTTYWLTGPVCFTRSIEDYLKQIPTERININFIDYCYFGNYMVNWNKDCLKKAILIHHYDGIWKKQKTIHLTKTNYKELAYISIMKAIQNIYLSLT